MMLSSVQIGYRRLVATMREQLNHADHFKQFDHRHIEIQIATRMMTNG